MTRSDGRAPPLLVLASVLGLAGVAVLAGCERPVDLSGTAWDVTGYADGGEEPQRVLGGSELTLEFSADGRVTGSAGCNRLTGSYTVTGGGIGFEGVATTRRMCAEPAGVMAQEAAFLRALGAATAVRTYGDRLELRGEDGALLVSATRRAIGDAEPEASAGSEPAGPRPGLLGGEMVYMADAALITLCKTGESYPIAMEADYLPLERAYLAGRSGPGAPLYVTVEGSIEPRPRMEGEGTRPNLVVHRFVHAWPDMSCERARADAELVSTYWRVVRLGDQPVAAAEDRREPHIQLRDDDGPRYTATVGCNQLAGRYTIDGDELAFGPAAATRMACPAPLDALERKLSDTLARASGWRIEASVMELTDEEGVPLALFEAVYF